MASNAESLCSILILSALIASCVGQTFQYSRGWVNGKRSGMLAPPSSSRAIDQLINSDDIQEVCKQLFLPMPLAGVNPLAVRIMAMNPLSMHPETFYQRPQIKHDSEFIASPIPYGFVDTPLAPSSNTIDLSERYKRQTNTNH